MTPDAFYEIAYRAHEFSNPISADLLDRVLEAAELRPGQRAADLGCGRGGVSAYLANRFGLAVDAVDMSEAMLAGARERLAARDARAAGSVTLYQGRAEDFLENGGAYDLVVVTGATQLVTGAGERTAFFAKLRANIERGGHLLYGDPFWRRPPSAALASVSAPYDSHREYVRAGEAAGFEPRCALESSAADWDDYAWRMARSVGDWVRANPGHPAAPLVQGQARFMLDSYLDETRDSMGFGLYLFRAPDRPY